MDDLIKLVRTYRLTSGLAERLRLAEQIFRQIAPDLHLFVFNHISDRHADDVFQEVLKAVAVSLGKFKGNTEKEFFGFCYSIARNKLKDQYRKQASDLVIPVPPDKLRQMIEASAHDAPITAEVRHDLEYAMKLLTNSKPECYDFLWNHFVFGLDYADIAADRNMSYDNVRMKIGRCLEAAKSLVA